LTGKEFSERSTAFGRVEFGSRYALQAEKTFEPQMPSVQKEQLIKGWQRAIKTAQAWSEA